MSKSDPQVRFNLGRVFSVAILVLLATGAYGIYSSGLAGPITVQGIVKDAASGKPVDGAKVLASAKGTTSSSVTISTGSDGTYLLGDVPRGSTIRIEAEGYEPREFDPGKAEKADDLQPIVLNGRIRDSFSNAPIPGAVVVLGDQRTATGADGGYRFAPARRDTSLTVSAEGYDQATALYSGQADLEIGLRPNTLEGTIKDAASGVPVKNARVQVGDREATYGDSGTYKLTSLPPGPFKVEVSAPGYEKTSLDVKDTIRKDIQMKQFEVRALYLTYYGIADEGLRSGALDKIGKTEVNGLVIDVKGDRGFLVYKSDIPMARQIGAADNPTVRDFDSLMADFKKRNIYTIARVVVFKDNPLAMSKPDLAIIDTRTGKPWIDRENLAWVDPTRREVWDYNIAIAKEAAKKGFDEIQFDYIRFPTDGSVSTARYSRPNTQENRLEAIDGFLARARSELKPLGVALSIDTFGYTTWRDDDMGIGQKIENIAKHVDFISPMVYPSTYSDGIPDYRNAVAHPYEIVYYSLKKANERLAGMPVKIRPWLQYFDDYPWATGMLYNAREIQAQKKASADATASGWMLWDPTNMYKRGGLNAN